MFAPTVLTNAPHAGATKNKQHPRATGDSQWNVRNHKGSTAVADGETSVSIGPTVVDAAAVKSVTGECEMGDMNEYAPRATAPIASVALVPRRDARVVHRASRHPSPRRAHAPCGQGEGTGGGRVGHGCALDGRQWQLPPRRRADK